MSDLTTPPTRAEIEEFWDSWLAINRQAERTGDWRVMAEWYAEDATYGWMYSVDEHFMAVGRDQIREWAIGIEMDGLDGWHYDYQVHADRRQERDGRRVLEAAVGDHQRRDRQGVRDPRHRRLLVRRRAADVPAPTRASSSSRGSATGSTCRRPRTPSSRSSSAGKAPDTLLKRMSVTGHDVPGHYHLKDIPAPVWPPPVERGDYLTQQPVEADA